MKKILMVVIISALTLGVSATEAPPILEQYVSWYERNNDVVGFLRINGTVVNYPVLQGDDNDYYLDYNIDHRRSSAASITADFRNRFDGFNISDNTLLYGHNQLDGTMFRPIMNYYTSARNLTSYKSAPVVNFDTLHEELEWKIFAVVWFNTMPRHGEVIYFWNYINFADKNEFNDYILMLMDRSVIHTEVDVQHGDQILSLMTCHHLHDSRVVVFARRLRPGESNEVDVSKATHNPKAFKFGESTGESVWDRSLLKSYDMTYDGIREIGKGEKYALP
jgi:sortase B